MTVQVCEACRDGEHLSRGPECECCSAHEDAGPGASGRMTSDAAPCWGHNGVVVVVWTTRASESGVDSGSRATGRSDRCERCAGGRDQSRPGWVGGEGRARHLPSEWCKPVLKGAAQGLAGSPAARRPLVPSQPPPPPPLLFNLLLLSNRPGIARRAPASSITTTAPRSRPSHPHARAPPRAPLADVLATPCASSSRVIQRPRHTLQST